MCQTVPKFIFASTTTAGNHVLHAGPVPRLTQPDLKLMPVPLVAGVDLTPRGTAATATMYPWHPFAQSARRTGKPKRGWLSTAPSLPPQ